MRIFIWILIIGLVWILLIPVNEGFKKKPKINIKKSISKVANKVGGAVTKIATSGLDSNAKKVLKNIGKIKDSIRSFTKKGGDEYVPIPMQPPIQLSAKKM
jgi:hypothetical protein